MKTLSFLLSLGVIGALVAVAVAPPLAWLATRRGLPAAAQADRVLLSTSVAAVVVVAVVVVAALSSLLAVVGVGDHHCLAHGHHVHLCPEHIAPVTPWLATAGMLAWGLALTRFVVAVVRTTKTNAAICHAVALGERVVIDDVDVVLLAGPPCILHATRQGVVASRSLLLALTPSSRRAALWHERAHVERGDPHGHLLLTLATALCPPGLDRIVRRTFLAAADDAADDVAAAATDAITVAAALVEVARGRLTSPLDAAALAFNGSDIERRVQRLLAASPASPASPSSSSPSPSSPSCSWRRPLVVVVSLVLVLAVSTSGLVHHAAETALAHLLHPLH
jgi:hypothetical protein